MAAGIYLTSLISGLTKMASCAGLMKYSLNKSPVQSQRSLLWKFRACIRCTTVLGNLEHVSGVLQNSNFLDGCMF